MSNYVQSTNFATKDSLPSGDPLKIVKGTEINTEFANIAIAVATKADLNSPTLVTPNIGTPSAGVLTNCTGLPMTTGVTGTLPVANGGTGVTSSTGSGNVVLSNSPSLSSPTLSNPTLTTPVLGTPSSGTLSNCTGLPLTSGVTGTLPVANGGTGVTNSTGSGSNVLSASPALTGTPTAPTASSGTNTTQLATTAFVQTALQALHPVGSIYTSTVSTNPGTLFGFGTWTAFGAGRVLIGDGGGFSAGSTGGSADAIVVSHTHTATVTDSGHSHGGYVGTSAGGCAGGGNAVPTGTINATTNTATTGISVAISTTGSSGTNANLQPYIVVYMWQRTA